MYIIHTYIISHAQTCMHIDQYYVYHNYNTHNHILCMTSYTTKYGTGIVKVMKQRGKGQ